MSENVDPAAACDFCGGNPATCGCDRPGNSGRPNAKSGAVDDKLHLKRCIKTEFPPLSNTGFCCQRGNCRACRERDGLKLPHRILTHGISHTGQLAVLKCHVCGDVRTCRPCLLNLANRVKRRVCKYVHCRMVLSSRRALRRHERITHGKVKEYFCEICKLPISDRPCLLRHFQRKHQKSPAEGEARELEPGDLQRHRRRRAAFKLRPGEFLRCLFCPSTFTDETQLGDHVTAEHAEVGINTALVQFDRRYGVGSSSFLRRLIDHSRGYFDRFLQSLKDGLLEMIVRDEVELTDIGVCGAATRNIFERLLRCATGRIPPGRRSDRQIVGEAVAVAVRVFRMRLRVLWNSNRQHARKRKVVKAERVVKRRNAISVEETQHQCSRIIRKHQRQLDREAHLEQIINRIAMVPLSSPNASPNNRENGSVPEHNGRGIQVYEWQDLDFDEEDETDLFARSHQAYSVGNSYLHSLVYASTTFEQFIQQLKSRLPSMARMFPPEANGALEDPNSATAGPAVVRIHKKLMEAIRGAVPTIDGQRDRGMLATATAEQVARIEGVLRFIWNVNSPHARDGLVPNGFPQGVELERAPSDASNQRKRPRLDASRNGGSASIGPGPQRGQPSPLHQLAPTLNDTGLPAAQDGDSMVVGVDDSELGSLASDENGESNPLTTDSIFESDLFLNNDEGALESDDDACVFLGNFDRQGRRLDVPAAAEQTRVNEDDQEINPTEIETAANHKVPSACAAATSSIIELAVDSFAELTNDSNLPTAPVEENSPSLLGDNFPRGNFRDLEEPLAEPPRSQNPAEATTASGDLDELGMHARLDPDNAAAAAEIPEASDNARVSEHAAASIEQEDGPSLSTAKRRRSPTTVFVEMQDCFEHKFLEFGHHNDAATLAMERMITRLCNVSSKDEWTAIFPQESTAEENLFTEH